MKGFVENLEDRTEKNSDFRRVVYTAKNLQLVLMAIPPDGDIGEEVHPDRDQFFQIEDGKGEIEIDGVVTKVNDDVAMLVPAGARHNIRNTGQTMLRLFTVYGPPEHKDGTVHKTKKDAKASKEHFDDKTTE